LSTRAYETKMSAIYLVPSVITRPRLI